jgi:hypothetical protein
MAHRARLLRRPPDVALGVEDERVRVPDPLVGDREARDLARARVELRFPEYQTFPAGSTIRLCGLVPGSIS